MGKAHRKPPRRPLPAPAGWVALAVLVAAAVVPYLNSLNGTFHFDDTAGIERNQDIRSFDGLLSARPLNRWLTFLTFYVNYRLGGLEFLPGWHAVNILLHAASVLALYGLLRRMQAGGDAPPGALAFYAALLFAVHPLASEPVNYLQARSVQMYTLFTVLGLLGVLLARRRSDRAGQAAGLALLATSVVLAALSKEVGLFFAPAAAGLYWLLFIARGWSRRRWLLAGGIALGILAAGLAWLAVSGALSDMAARVGPTFSAHALGQTIVFWRYVGLALLPLPGRLNVDHYVRPYVPTAPLGPAPYALSHADVLLAVAGLVALAAVAVWLRKRRAHLSFFLLLVPLGLAPYFLMASAEMMVEYRFYLPLAGGCVLAAAGLLRLLHGRGGLAIACVLCVALAVCTAVRNRAWRTNITLWEDAVRKVPYKARTVNALAWALATDKHNPDPKRALELALKSLDRTRVRPWPGENPFMLDTLAEAYYANGMYDQAVQIESDVLRYMEQHGMVAHREFIEEQLAKYVAARDARRAATASAPGARTVPTSPPDGSVRPGAL